MGQFEPNYPSVTLTRIDASFCLESLVWVFRLGVKKEVEVGQGVMKPELESELASELDVELTISAMT